MVGMTKELRMKVRVIKNKTFSKKSKNLFEVKQFWKNSGWKEREHFV